MYDKNFIIKESKEKENLQLFSWSPILFNHFNEFKEKLKPYVSSDVLDSISITNNKNYQGLNYEIIITMDDLNITPAIVQILIENDIEDCKVVSLDEAMKLAPYDIYPNYNGYDLIYK